MRRGEHGSLERRQALLKRLGGHQIEVVGRLVEQQKRRAGQFEQQDLETCLLAAEALRSRTAAL
jgi:hypothetical protein